MTLTNADRMAEARRFVERALDLVIEADETLAAAELEQALDTISRHAGGAAISSAASPSQPSGTR